ncbi:MAG: metallophosphoesterase [Alphaproteobacteria bacterium]|nr:metallophosphoesterase [Alphaproteobacteria bacterium]
MKIALASDLHLEHSLRPDVRPASDIDLLIFAGDIHKGTQGMDWIEQNDFSCPSLYVAGNHEFYGSVYQRLEADLRERSSQKVIYLNNDIFEFGGYTFIGSTLWTDYEYHRSLPADLNMFNADANLNDHRQIVWREEHEYTYFHPKHARELHMTGRAFIEAQVAKVGREKSIVITHHAPTGAAIPPRHLGDSLNGCFVSDLDAWIYDHGPRVWMYGHVHWDIDIMIGETRVVSRQGGYRNERAATGQPPFELLTIELP